MPRSDPAPSERHRLRRRARTAIFVTVLLDLLGFGMILPILPFYGQAYGASDFQVGLLFASYSAAQLVFAPLLGRLSDRVGRRPVLLATIAGGLLAHLAFAAAGSFAVLVAARTAAGLAAGNLGIAQAFMADVTEPGERSKAMGLIGAAFGLGFVLGPAFGGMLALIDRVAVPLGAAALGAINLGMAARWLPESLDLAVRERSRGRRWFDPRALGRLLADRPLLGLMILFFLVTFSISLMEATLALFVQQRFAFGDWETSWLFVLVGVVMVVVQGGLVGRAVARWGERRLIPVGMAAMAIGLLLIGSSGAVATLALALAVLAFGAGLNNPSTLGLLSQLTGEETQGGVLGLSRSFGALARTVGPLAGTWIFGQAGPPWPFWAAGGVMAASLLLAVWVVRGASGRTAASTER
ncbi:MAG TPA: MFS transporter [Thermoanaerobaculia bacterium]|nr:MFS transporter [Thermoanaerobaculia bacterium]